MRPSIGQYVRALHEFETCQKGEITLLPGDIIRITDVIDDNWLCGDLNGVEGNFPSNFVESVDVPAPKPGQKIFAAIDDFPVTQEGDLSFCRGDIIEGTYQIDENWWQGTCSGVVGMFPLTCVTELRGSVQKKPLKRLPTVSTDPDEPLFAQALVDVVPQIDGELGFGAGDMITITEVLDSDWYVGQFGGKEGLVSSVCVRMLVDNNNVEESSAGNLTSNDDQGNRNKSAFCVSKSTTAVSSFSSENTRSHDAEITPYARTLYPFQGQSNEELSFEVHEIVTLIQHVDTDWIEGELDGKIGLFPGAYVEIIVDCQHPTRAGQKTPSWHKQDPVSRDSSAIHSRGGSADASSEGVESCSISSSDSDQFGLVLHNFDGDIEGDLKVSEGETVIILQILDKSWIQARSENGSVGIVPLNHVQVIGEGPKHVSSHAGRSSDQRFLLPDNQNGITTEAELSKFSSKHDQCKEVEQLSLQCLDVKPGPVVKKPSVLSEKPSPTSKKQSPVLDKPSPSSEKPKLQPKPLLKPKLAPKPVIKPKPLVLAPKPYVRPVEQSAQSIKHVSSPTEKQQVFKDINSSKSLSSLIDEQLQNAKAEAESIRSRSNSTKSTESTSSSSSLKKQESLPGHLLSSEAVTTRSRPSSLVSDRSSRPSSEAFETISDLDQLAHQSETGLLSSFDLSAQQPKNSLEQNDQFSSSFQSYQTEVQSTRVSNGFINTGFVKDHDDPQTLHTHLPTRPPPPVPSLKGSKSKARAPPQRAPPPRPSAPRPAAQMNRQLSSSSSSNAKDYPVPRRPAPPVPKGPPKMPSRPSPPRPSMPSAPRRPPPRPPAKAGSDLMSFSPERETVQDAEDEVNAEVVAELKGRIAEIQKDIQNYEKSCTELGQMLGQVSEDEREEIQETLDDQRANVQGLTQELANLRQNLHQLCPAEQRKYDLEQAAERRKEEVQKKMEEEKKRHEEMKQKRREKRENVIQELLCTEKDYLHDLHLCMDTFLGPSAEKVPGLDMEALFGNIEEIADVSQKLLTRLEGCINGRPFDEQIIGPNFVDFAEDMKNTYAPYCRNHDTVIATMEKYTDNVEVRDYINRTIMKLREQINVFDLESLLIKPVQRILKYPLLLNELFKSTEDDHPDKQEIMKAINAMTDVATAINEYKRRKDLVFKYKKESDQRFSNKIAKLNFHSIRKKSSRMRGRLSTNLGLSLQTRDENFEKEEFRFRHIEKAVRVFQKDVIVYIDQIQESIGAEESLVADIVDLYDGHPSQEVQKYREVQEKVVGPLLQTFRCTVEDLVISPLGRLIQKFDGPNNVIEKRFDKLLDYDSQFRKAKDNEKNDALVATRNDYEAMNAQLLDELPKLYQLALQMLTDCMGAFAKAQKTFMDQALKETYSLGQLPLLLGSETGIMESFNIHHTAVVDQVSGFCFIPRGFNPKMDSLKPDKKQKRMSLDQGGATKPASAVGSASPQSDSQRVYLRQLYPSTKLFRVGYTYQAMDMMDLSLNEGVMVGVIKDQDPMGNKDKWFIDDGVKKGFIPKKVLAPWTSDLSSGLGGGGPSPTGSLISLTTEEGQEEPVSDHMADLLSLSGGSDQSTLYPSLNPEPTTETPSHDEYYYAEYAFTSRGASEVTLFEGQVVTVVTKADQEGNTEWWLVDADGQHGYAPANYLRPMSN